MTPSETDSKKNALATQMLRGVFGVYLFIAVTVTVAHMVAEYFNTENAIYQEMEQIHGTFESGLAQSLWNMNDEHARSIPQGILNLPVITRVQLFDDRNILLSDIGKNSTQANALVKSFPIIHIARNKPNIVGTLTLSSSREIIINKLRHGFIFILVNAIIKSFALWCIFLWFGKRLINIPLHTLTRSIKKLDLNNLHATTIPSPVSNKNEISMLTSAFNNLINNLAEAKSEIDDNHRQLELEIQEHKRAKEEIQQLNSVLDERVKTRTIELERSQQKAQKANLEKTQFLSRMSHELRTPLNEILGFAQVQERLLRNDGSRKQQETTYHILDAGQKLLCIIEDILNYLHIEENNETILLESCNIDLAVQEAVQQVNETHKNDNIQINYSPSNLLAKSNVFRLIQVITHIVSNGVKYNHEKGSVNIMCSLAADERIEIAIQDTGVGIKKEHWFDIFSPFTRLDYAELNQIGGVGVGLSLAKTLMQKMQGDVTLSHSSTDGSLFIISLPKADKITTGA